MILVSRRGFSLAELLISILILAILSVLMVGVLPSAIFGLRAAQQQLAAASLARGAMEELRQQGFGALKTADLGLRTVDRLDYHLTCEVTDLPLAVAPPPGAPPAPWVRDVTVTVTWDSRQGQRTYRVRRTFARMQ